MLGEPFRLLGVGWKDSSKTFTKLLGNNPTALGSLRSLPIHHSPSPAFKASIRSPSMNPRSFFVSPPHEYVARHQHGNLGGRSGGAPIVDWNLEGTHEDVGEYTIDQYCARSLDIKPVLS